jgi:hypothetical protein
MADHNEGIEHGYHAHMGKVSKRLNSTKRIALADLPDEFPFYMKRACSMEAPVIYVRLNSLNISPQYNYCYIEETHSYYWIKDITALNANNWQFSLEIDPLATYRDEILKTKAYILYGFNEDASGVVYRLQDTRQAVARHPIISTASADITGGLISTTKGKYILSAVGKKGLCSYMLDAGDLQNLLSVVSTTWAALTKPMVDWKLALPEFMNNFCFGDTATSCIRSCIWLPIDIPGAGRATEITLGQFDTGVSGRIVTASSNFVQHTDIAIPWPVADWKRMNCQIQLYVPNVGIVGVPVDQCNGATSIGIDWCLCCIDGSVTVRVTAGSYECFVGSTNIASTYGIGTSNLSVGNMLSGASQALGGAMEVGGGIGAAMAGFGTAAQGAISTAAGIRQAIQPINQTVGTIAGASQTLLPTDAKLVLLYYPPIDDSGFQSVYGHPVMRVSTPVKGYCQTNGFSCQPLGAELDEIAYINAAMDGGVFIE